MKLSRLVLFIVCALFSIPSQAQNKCTLKISEAPELRGFRLGMAVDEVAKRLKGVRDMGGGDARRGKFGEASLEFYAHDPTDTYGLKGVSKIKLKFLDERLTSVKVDYSFDTKWDSVDEFVSKIAPALKVPAKWAPATIKFNPNDDPPLTDELPYDRIAGINSMVLPCDGFELRARVVGSAELGLYDISAPKTIEQRMKKAGDSKKEAFKP